MPTDAPLAPAVRSETAAPYAACAGAPPPSAETLIARIERAGPAALDDHELLALVGIHVDAATLAAVGGLRELLDDPDDMLRVVLLTPEDRARVHALHEVHARWMEARLRRNGGPLTSPAHTRRSIEARLRGYRNEVFACLFLDNRHRIIAFEELFRGTLDGTSVYPRVVVRRAITGTRGRTAARSPGPRSPPPWRLPRARIPPGTAARPPSGSCTPGTPRSPLARSWTGPSMRSSHGPAMRLSRVGPAWRSASRRGTGYR